MKKKLLWIAASLLVINMSISTPVTIFASQEDVSAVTSAIDSLPSMEDLSSSDAERVKNVWIAYNELSTAEKIAVPNSEKLIKEYNKLVKTGVLKDEKKEQDKTQKELEAQREKEEVSKKEASQVTNYTFEYNSSKPISVVMRYTTDADGDEKGDVPGRITLTSPKANTYPISNINTKLSDDGLTVGLNWEENFLQLDFATAANGKWTISTSIPCTFNAINYAGAKQDIVPNEEQDQTQDADTETNTETNVPIAEEDKGSGINIVGILGVGALVGIFAGLIILYKKIWPKSDVQQTNFKQKKNRKAKADDTVYEENEPRPMSDEEIIAQMKAEYEASMAQEKEIEEADEVIYQNATVEEDEYMDLDEITQEDLDNDETIEEYTEGETGLLYQEDNLPNNRQQSNSFFDDDDFEF